MAPVLNAEITAAELTAWQTFDVAGWAAELFALAQSTAYTKPDGTRVLDGDVLSDPYTRRLRCAPNGSSKPACDWHTDQRSSGGNTPVNMLWLAP